LADRETKEQKLIALMVNDLGPGFVEKEMAGLQSEVRSLPDEELGRTLTTRLNLSPSVDDEALEQDLSHVEEPEEISRDDFTRAPDMSHEPRPEEREG
jgi:hypothetical protein